jgi:hypothetical protein
MVFDRSLDIVKHRGDRVSLFGVGQFAKVFRIILVRRHLLDLRRRSSHDEANEYDYEHNKTQKEEQHNTSLRGLQQNANGIAKRWFFRTAVRAHRASFWDIHSTLGASHETDASPNH